MVLDNRTSLVKVNTDFLRITRTSPRISKNKQDMLTFCSSGRIAIGRANTLGVRSGTLREEEIARFKSRGPDSATSNEGEPDGLLSEAPWINADFRQTCDFRRAEPYFSRR